MIAVLLFHARSRTTPNGFLGVDVFFVISGFVLMPMIMQIFDDQSIWQGLKKFFSRRFLRLAPAFGTTILITTPFIIFFGNLNDIQRYVNQAVSSILLGGNIGAIEYSGNYFSPNPNPLLHTWSLSVEQQIYIAVPIILVITRVLATRNFKGKVLVVMSSLFIASLLLFLFPQIYGTFGPFERFSDPEQSYYFTLSRLWEFLGGALLYIHRTKSDKKLSVKVKTAALICIILVLFIPIDIEAVLATVFVVFLSCLFLLGESKDRQMNFTKLLEFCGNCSYSIYVIHMPIIYFAKYSSFFSKYGNSQMRVTLAILLSLLLGFLQFKYVEQKFRHSLRIFQTFSFFVVCPLLILGLANIQINQNFAPLVTGFASDSMRDSHLLKKANCVDVSFSPKRCTWGTGKRGSIVLVGDSQSYAAADGVRMAAAKLGLGFTGATLSGCPFLGIDSTLDKPINCLAFQRGVMEYIIESKATVVVIANRTFGYLNPELNWRKLVEANGEVVDSRQAALKVYKESLSDLVLKLTSNGVRVLLYQQVPEVKNFKDPTSLFEYITNSNYFKNDNAEVALDNKVRLLEYNLSINLKFDVFDPSSIICSGTCRSSVDISDSYMDSFHLSRQGSLRMQKSLERTLSRLISNDDITVRGHSRLTN